MISVAVLLVVFILIAVRRVGSIRLQIWQVMLLGALGVLVARQISPERALRAINLDVIFFLFGMFLIGEALERSGYLAHLSCRLFRHAGSPDTFVLLVLFGMGLLAALLMNDTIAIIGTPMVLLLARRTNMPAKPLLLALSFAVTIGSVVSPIGNPQNLLIALDGHVSNPFVTFLKYLFLPSTLNGLVAFALLRLFYRRHFAGKPLPYAPQPITDARLARLCQVSLFMLVALIIAKIVTVFAGWEGDFRLTYIALASALPVVLFSPGRWRIVRGIDWSTLVFFAAMFVLMAAVWDSGFFQAIMSSLHVEPTSVGIVLLVSVLVSQFISNVPLVALYLPVLNELGASTGAMMALAAGSTIAGNLSILGAASNVIIIQTAEKKAGETLTFLEFARIGLPLTALNLLVYWLFSLFT